MENGKITSFTDLKAWKESHILAISIYQLTETFPASDKFGLASQIRRASVSVTSNIAEGFGRTAIKDKEHFYTIASGSLYEIKSQLILAKDLDFISNDEFKNVADQANLAHKLLNGLLKVHRKSEKPNV